VLQVTKSGLVVDSGYPSLLQPPLNHSWVTRADVVPARPAALLEGTAPDSIAVGLVFLTDTPRRPAVHQYDYVAPQANTTTWPFPASRGRFVDLPVALKRPFA
jgi:hypothetical protein